MARICDLCAQLLIDLRIGGPKWKFEICGVLQFCGNLVGNSGAGRLSCPLFEGLSPEIVPQHALSGAVGSFFEVE